MTIDSYEVYKAIFPAFKEVEDRAWDIATELVRIIENTANLGVDDVEMGEVKVTVHYSVYLPFQVTDSKAIDFPAEFLFVRNPGILKGKLFDHAESIIDGREKLAAYREEQEKQRQFEKDKAELRRLQAKLGVK